MAKNEAVPSLTSEEIFNGNKYFFTHLSTDYTEYEGRLHSHEFAEISHIVSGEAEHEISGNKYRVHRGDVIVIKRGVPHTFRPIDCGEPFVAYDLMFTEDFILDGRLDTYCSSVRTELFDDTVEYKDIHLSGVGYQQFGELFDRIYSEFCARRPGYLTLIHAYLTELLITLFRRLENERDDKLPVRLRNAVRSTVAYIEENYSSHITLEELAARIFFSKDYLNKVFRRIVGMPVGSYIQKVRFEVACKLLSNTDKTVTEIAELSGFGDVKSFYTVFKRKTSMTPGEFRGE